MKHVVLLSILFVALYSKSEAQVYCDYDSTSLIARAVDSISYDAQRQQHLNTLQRFRTRQTPQSDFKSGMGLTSGCRSTRYVIPVVVHIVHTAGDSLPGIGGNITDAQVQNAIDKLNRWYAKEDSASPMATNTMIQFCLATNRAGGAISRHSNSLARPRYPADDSALKQLGLISTDSFLNIWIVTEILNNNYTHRPSGGYGSPWFFPMIQGIVVLASRMGEFATCSSCNLDSNSRVAVLAHEAGHYLTLWHTFDDGCVGLDSLTCGYQGDACCDTRPEANPIFTCPSYVTQSCASAVWYDTLGIYDAPENFMSYQDEPCKNTFTQGQVSIMHSTLLANRRILISPGNANTVQLNCCFSTAYFQTENNFACTGDPIDLITFDYSGATYQWDFYRNGSGTVDSTITVSTPDLSFTLNRNGVYDVQLTIFIGSDTIIEKAFRFLEFAGCGTRIASTQGNWYFGDHAGLNFTTTKPIRDVNPFKDKPFNINCTEGTISQSTSQGRLLFYGGVRGFYGDTLDMYDSTYKPMLNGKLLCNGTTAQGVLSIPLAGNNNKYWIIHGSGLEPLLPNRGLRFSILDMTLNSNKGGFSNNLKNIPITISGSNSNKNPNDGAIYPGEGLTAIPRCNGTDYWLLVSDDNSNNAASYPNRKRIHTYSVASTITYSGISYLPADSSDDFTFIKASPDGTKIVTPSFIFDFDRKTGTLSNRQYLGHHEVSYSGSFSPNSKFFYQIVQDTNTPTSRLYQYDIYSNDIWGTKIEVHSGLIPTNYTQLQIGPDNKIYIASGIEQLYEISYPDSQCTNLNTNACGFTFNGPATSLNGLGGNSIFGLPNMINAKASVDLDFNFIQNNCNTFDFSANTTCPTSFLWDFGNGDTSTLEKPTETFTNGTYTVTLIAGADTVSKVVTVGLPTTHIGGDTIICDTSTQYTYSITLKPNIQYSWSAVGGTILNNFINSAEIKWSADSGYVQIISYEQRTGCLDTSVRTVKLETRAVTFDSITKPTTIFKNCSFTLHHASPSVNPDDYSYRWMLSTDTGSTKTYSHVGTSNKDYTLSVAQKTWVYCVTSTACFADSGNILILEPTDSNHIYLAGIGCSNQLFNVDGNTPTGIYTYAYQVSTDSVNWTYLLNGTSYRDVPWIFAANQYVRRSFSFNGCTIYSNVLNLPVTPTIVVQPRDTTACVPNTGALFTMSATLGNWQASLRYQWQVRHSGGAWANIGSPQSSGNLLGSQHTFANGNLVRCKLYADCGTGGYVFLNTISDSVTLNTTTLSITTQPANVTATEATKAIFKVVSNGTAYTWQRQAINGNYYDMANTDNDTLTLAPLQYCWAGKYRVVVADACGNDTISNYATLTVTKVNADLWSHDSPKDTGAEPNILSQSDTDFWYWRSIDIWNRQTEDMDSLWHNYNAYITDLNHQKFDHARVTQNMPNYVYTRIYNKGTDTAKMGKLYLYWTIAATGERWPKDWKKTLADTMQDSMGDWHRTGGEINDTAIIIPALPPGKDTVIVYPFYPPDPTWFRIKQGLSFGRHNEIDLCVLARIQTCDDQGYGITFKEDTSTSRNVGANNNIITRNTVLIDSLKTNGIPDPHDGVDHSSQRWVYVRNISDSNRYIHLNVRNTNGDFFPYGTLSVYLDDDLKLYWNNGGSLVSGLESQGDTALGMIDNFSFWLHNLIVPAGKGGFIGFKYSGRWDMPVPGPTPFDFHVIQYESSLGMLDTGTYLPPDTTGQGALIIFGQEGTDSTWGSDTTAYNLDEMVLTDLQDQPMTMIGGVHFHIDAWPGFSEKMGAAERKKKPKVKPQTKPLTNTTEICNELRISPNPNGGSFILRIPQNFIGQQLCIYDAQGRLIQCQQLSGESTNLKLNTNSPGIYLLRVNDCKVKMVVQE